MIADRLGVPLHRVNYVIDSRGIAPTATAGRIRLFDSEAVEAIADALRRIDAAREGANHA